MTNKAGFTIIEWLIYFFLIIFVLTGLFHFVATTQQRLLGLSTKSSEIAQLVGAQDGLAGDIAVAPTDPEVWTVLAQDKLAWTKKKKKICWSFEKGKLYRCEQRFDAQKKEWKKKRKAIVCRSVEQVYFEPNYKTFFGKQVLGSVTCRLQQRGQTIERTVLLRNRNIL